MIGAAILLSAAALACSVVFARFAPRLWAGAVVAGAGMALAASAFVLAGGAAWEWRAGFALGGEPPSLRLDAVSAVFLALLAVVGAAGAVYAEEYWGDAEHPRSARAGRAWWSAILICIGMVLLAANGLLFLVAWELFAVSGYFLITLDAGRGQVREAGWLYLAASHAGTLCLFAFFAGLAASTGSWALGPMHGQPGLAPLFWLALVGFGLKAGMFPLHIWLPSAHANAPSHVSAILSGVALKVGVYGIVRFGGWLDIPAGAAWAVAALGVASAVLGVAFALGQHDLKRLLAYHSVENVGIILIGAGFAMAAFRHGYPAWGRLAMAGALLHVWNHGLFKSLLFFGAGSVVHATGTREMSHLGGLWRAMPWTASLFALGAAAIAGLPPLNGFISEWLVYLGLFGAVLSRGTVAWTAAPAAICLGVTGALALACFVKVCGVVFLGEARSAAARRAHECGPRMRGAMIFLGALCVLIGLAPAFFWPAIARAVGDWQPAWEGTSAPVPLVALGNFDVALALLGGFAAFALWRLVRVRGLVRGPTWDCGYAAPTPRMQYSAGSFAGILTGLFAWILRPVRHGHLPQAFFPQAASWDEHTPETVLERVVEPAGGAVRRLALAARHIQHGTVQAYILYLLIGLAAVAAMVIAGGD